MQQSIIMLTSFHVINVVILASQVYVIDLRITQSACLANESTNNKAVLNLFLIT